MNKWWESFEKLYSELNGLMMPFQAQRAQLTSDSQRLLGQAEELMSSCEVRDDRLKVCLTQTILEMQELLDGQTISTLADFLETMVLALSKSLETAKRMSPWLTDRELVLVTTAGSLVDRLLSFSDPRVWARILQEKQASGLDSNLKLLATACKELPAILIRAEKSRGEASSSPGDF